MDQIRLCDYIAQKKNISSEVLGHGETEIPRNKILLAYLFDFSVIYAISAMLKVTMEATAKTLMVTEQMQEIWAKTSMAPFLFVILATVSFSYFFFSFFFNEGQTWGMHSVKTRINMESYSFSDSFRWTLSSLFLYLSGGLFIHKINRAFKHHDHLYLALVQIREATAPDLHSLTAPEEAPESSFEIAA